jgi:N-acetylglucosamine kinase-like BadF-type ATPase
MIFEKRFLIQKNYNRMAIIIADSGATKTNWIIVENNKQQNSIQTLGFNPYYYSINELNKEVQGKVLPLISLKEIETIYFYGSGISTASKIAFTKTALQNCFPNIPIEVDHDLLGAARGLLLDKTGIACILGTGANSCVYDGTNITHNIPSLGYFFADEGSGTHIGKLFIESFLRDKLPLDLKDIFVKEYNLNNELILENIYSKEYPNKFLSSFSKFVSKNIYHPYMQKIVTKSFSEFFETYILEYPNYKKLNLVFTGSVAEVFQDLLKNVALVYGLSISNIIKNPMDGLIKYHCKKY